LTLDKIGLGGGCHWCTEGVFKTLIGVHKIDQGWIASENENNSFSEAIIVYYDSQKIDLKDLIEVHLLTHSSTSNHSMRHKYRSAIYTFTKEQISTSASILKSLQENFGEPIITKVLPFKNFKQNEEMFTDYFYKSPLKPFCKNHIHPKLSKLIQKHKNLINKDNLNYLIKNGVKLEDY